MKGQFDKNSQSIIYIGGHGEASQIQNTDIELSNNYPNDSPRSHDHRWSSIAASAT